ncbi:hypothetical protein WJX73_002348 [Symbiochloris irregularis]|uniref:Vacuolar fusion protein MON1 homolog n=1 Tax=Symbiochloris irregularis TaxID=706552 RepID=A0AAW1NYR2_9CHLO
MVSPTKPGPRVSGDFEALLSQAHSRSSSEVVGPGDEQCSVVDASELESVPGSEGAATEQGPGPAVQLLEQAATAAEEGRNEDSEVWRQQRKHLFVLTHSGKPVYSLHGDENALAGLMAVMDALISFMKDQGDSLQSVRAGRHIIVFLERGPLYLVAAAATGEPVSVLHLQLHLLHSQILCILTDGFQKVLTRNARFDTRRLLGGVDGILEALHTSFEVDPSAFLVAFAPLRMPALLRRSLLLALQTAVREGGALYGVLLAGSKVAALSQGASRPLHPHDLLALGAFVRGSPSFQAAETFSPVCLPHFNPSAFLHAYVHYAHKDAKVCLLLLSTQPDSFMRLADAARRFRAEVNDSGALQAAARSGLQAGEGQVSISSLPALAGGGEPGMTPLLHFLYKHPGRSQFVLATWDALAARGRLPQDVVPHYARIHAAVFRKDEEFREPQPSPLRVYYHSTDEYAAIAYASAEYELYALFDPLAQKLAIVQICQRLCAWVKGSQQDLFVPM